MTEQERTINRIERSMRKWIKDNIPVYEAAAPTQEVRTTQGERVQKANPVTQEIRAAFKDYCYIVKVQKEIRENGKAANISSIKEMRKRFKAV
ncbi:MAG: hypothetical protein IJ860_07880 [Eubacterium sp.]|nr:hypothetical protein [Eubacterium sp.]